VRAEPVAALYEQDRVHHVGSFPLLEDQMTAFVPDLDRGRSGSPDRCDSMVWAMTELLVEREAYAGLFDWYAAEGGARWGRGVKPDLSLLTPSDRQTCSAQNSPVSRSKLVIFMAQACGQHSSISGRSVCDGSRVQRTTRKMPPRCSRA
jgi:hypothetical protein